MDSGGPIVFEPFGKDTWRDPYPLYERLRDEDPVHRTPAGLWVLSRFHDVWTAARDTSTYSSAQGLTFINEVEELRLNPTIVMMDPPDHTRYRRLVSRGFTPRRVEVLEPRLRSFVHERLVDLIAAGEGDFVSGLAAPTPNWVVGEYLGVPEDDRDKFGRWTEFIVQSSSGEGHGEGSESALADLYSYFTELIERRRSEPGDDLISVLIAADDDGAIGLEGILGYAFVMIAGGNDTAIGLLGGIAELLTAWPAERRRLLDDRALIPNAVEEALRMTSPVQGLCRVTTRDIEMPGHTIRAGERVLLLYGAANRDPREFGPNPDDFDCDRRFPHMLSFSSGAHFCLGAAAARLQGRIVLDELLSACPDFAVDPSAAEFADGAFTRRYLSLPFVAN